MKGLIISKLKKRNIGIMITDHNVREALNIVDIVYIANEGKIMDSGLPNEVIKNEQVRSSYLGDAFNLN